MMRLRPYRQDDAAFFPDIFDAAVSVTALNHYDQRQVDAWLTLNPGEAAFAKAYGDGRIAIVIVDGDERPMGFADVEQDGHIQFFYCHPDVSGTGMAKALLEKLEESARATGIKRLSAEASETAVGLFRRHGFTLGARRNLRIDGVPIHNYAMSKELD
ncbi:MAG: GNAT family N-acetyltransferase [Oricola sp.]|nr:GNAT family N-acetyltransferase [Oricola sp.]